MVGEKLAKIEGAKKEASKVKIGNKFESFEGKFNIASGKFNLTNFIMDFREAKTAIIGRGYGGESRKIFWWLVCWHSSI